MRKFSTFFFMALMMAMVLGSPPFLLSEDKLLDKESYLDMESLRSPHISPDGDQIIFTRRWVDKKKDRFNSNLWIVDVEGKRVRELTRGNWRDSSPVWSPGGRKIAFLSDRDGSTQIYVMWLETREIAQLTHLTRSPRSLTWSPDGKKLAFTMYIRDKESPLSVKLPPRPKGAQWAKPAIIIDRLSWRRDGRGPVPKGYSHIYTLDARVGGTPQKLTSGDYNHHSPRWSRDGKQSIFMESANPMQNTSTVIVRFTKWIQRLWTFQP